MLKIEDLEVSYGAVQALRGISMEVNDGEIVSLIGANGAGKTTTLHAITGLVPIKSGSVIYDGHDLRKTDPSRIVTMGLAHVPEGRQVFTRMTVAENLAMGAYFRKDKKAIAEDLERVYARFPRLKERAKQLAGTLSGGEQQMLAMGRAIMSAPKLIVMDEPSMGLSPVLVQEVFSIIRHDARAGHHDPARGAEREDGARHRRPGLCARKRPDHHVRRRPRSAARRQGPEGLSRRVNADSKSAHTRGCVRFFTPEPPCRRRFLQNFRKRGNKYSALRIYLI